MKQHAQGFEDFLQSPLQPLMDNLESCTYEVFEKDPIKYTEYKRAIHRALEERITDEEAKTRTLVLMVLGAGRGNPIKCFFLRGLPQGDFWALGQFMDRLFIAVFLYFLEMEMNRALWFDWR